MGHGRSPCAFSRRFCAVKSGAAGDGSFHDLRHTFATMALQNGVDVKTVSSMLGHYSAGFTLDTYAHVTTDAQLKAAQTMGNILISDSGSKLGQDMRKPETYRNEIKSYIVRTGMTMTEVVDYLSDEYGWSRSVPNLSGKLKRGSLRYGEVVELADALGYDIVWEKR